MKYTRLILIPLLLLPACSENANQQPALISELFKKPIIAESLKIYRNSKSIDQVAVYLKDNYQIDFYKEGEKLPQLIPYVNYSKKIHAGGRINEEMSFADIQGLLDAQGYTQTTATFNYLADVSALFEGGVLSPDQVYSGMVNLRVQVENNYSISESERFGISTVGQIVESNFYQIIDVVSQDEGAMVRQRSGLRTASWNWGAIWRVTRSIVLTSTVGALIGFVTYGPYGALIGGVVMSIVANADAVFNGYCHFAMQCDGGWRQECISGDCAPYIP